jgi:hypothetical protein
MRHIGKTKAEPQRHRDRCREKPRRGNHRIYPAAQRIARSEEGGSNVPLRVLVLSVSVMKGFDS